MNKFGLLKSEILQKITEAYASGDRSKMKKILTEVIKNKDFREMYLFYEDIENKYISDKESANLYVDRVTSLLKAKSKKIQKFSKDMSKKFGDVIIDENELYSNLDLLSENDTLQNLDKKIKGKNDIINHLMKPKKNKESSDTTFIQNENLLHTILANNFNTLYENTLNEEQQKELKKILTITDKELKDNFEVLKTDVIEKMNNIQTERTTDELNKKINEAREEISSMDVSKINYYKLQQLKNGI
jgi:hypothetical protein